MLCSPALLSLGNVTVSETAMSARNGLAVVLLPASAGVRATESLRLMQFRPSASKGCIDSPIAMCLLYHNQVPSPRKHSLAHTPTRSLALALALAFDLSTPNPSTPHPLPGKAAAPTPRARAGSGRRGVVVLLDAAPARELWRREGLALPPALLPGQ